MQTRLKFFVLLLIWILSATSAVAAPSVVELWPKGAPGEKGESSEERDFTKPTDNLRWRLGSSIAAWFLDGAD